jgi:excisionase family DNA binding protein
MAHELELTEPESSTPASAPDAGAHGWLCRACRAGESKCNNVPPRPDSACCACGGLPSVEEILAVLARALLERLPIPSPEREVPRRRAYPLREAAVLLGVSLTKVKDEIRAGRLSIVTAGRRRRVLDAEINRYLLAVRSRSR